MRYVIGFLCVCALGMVPLVGCSDPGGPDGNGGTGGMPECQSPDDCDDGRECTEDVCTDGMCDNAPVEDGTACGDGPGTCEAGACTGGIFACTEQGVRDAIAVGGGPHTFDCDGTTRVVTTEMIVIDNDVVLDGEGNLTVDGNEDHTVFWVESEVTAELRGFTVTGGNQGSSSPGGGILTLGTLTLTNSTVSGNTTGRTGAGGIQASGALTLTNSTVSGNTASAGAGGIQGSGALTLTNSTVSENTGYGIDAGGTLTLTNSTVSGNTAVGIYSRGDASATNSIVEGECRGPITSNGYNIESPGNGCGFDQLTDQFDISADDLKLGPLQDNGGPTMTHALGAGSVAIDVVPADMCEVTEDQRGFPRDSMCDVGAVEVQP